MLLFLSYAPCYLIVMWKVGKGGMVGRGGSSRLVRLAVAMGGRDATKKSPGRFWTSLRSRLHGVVPILRTVLSCRHVEGGERGSMVRRGGSSWLVRLAVVMGGRHATKESPQGGQKFAPYSVMA